MSLATVILAAGRGTRMKSTRPKVLQPLAGRSLLAHLLETVSQLKDNTIYPVIGYQADQVRTAFPNMPLHWVLQTNQHGTGHALQQALPLLSAHSKILVLVGDTPCISLATLNALVKAADHHDISLLTSICPQPQGLGRIVRNDQGQVQGIVEEKEATKLQKEINEINTGIYVFHLQDLQRWLPKLKNDNTQNECYLTDVIAMAVAEKKSIHTLHPHHTLETMSVNDRSQLAKLERAYQRQQAEAYMQEGVTFADPSRFDLRGQLQCGDEVQIDIDVIIEGQVQLGHRVRIGPFVRLKDTVLGDDVVIHAHCDIEGATVAADCDIGPFARLRPDTVMGEGAKIGNFVETKKIKLGRKSKANHLTYLGDAHIGDEVNIGAGTITCNYDGVNKHLTTIGNDVFVGSNSSLIAPVEIGDGATIGAGSVIAKSVPARELTVARAKQITISGWKRPVKKSNSNPVIKKVKK